MKKKVETEVVEETTTEITSFDQTFQNEDLNKLVAKLNEIISYLNNK